MSDLPPAQPPSYDDAVKASAPPQEGGYGGNQPPYPTTTQSPYPPNTQQQPTPYPTPTQQQPAQYPIPQQNYSYPAHSSGAPNATNYGAAPTPPQPYPPQPLQPGYGAPQHPPNIQYSQAGPIPGQQQYSYNTVTVVSSQAPPYAAGYGPGPVIATSTPQLLAQQRARRRLAIGIFIGFFGVVFFIIIMIVTQ